MGSVQNNCDLLVVSPHTDDAEIGLGGTIATLAAKGRKVWALDLTRGELGTNATPDQRWQEAAKASSALGLHGRLQLTLPDGFINATDRLQIGAVVWALRTFRPRIVISAPDPHRHPDHIANAALVKRAVFLARLVELEVKEPEFLRWDGGAEVPETSEKWIVQSLLSVCPDSSTPSLLFDISAKWQIKERALACYESQFHRGSGQRETHINSGSFLEKIQRRALRWGDLAGTERAEAFRTENIPVFEDFSEDFRWRS